MDLRTGRTYSTKEEALAAGVPESDIAEFDPADMANPDRLVLPRTGLVVTTGPFKGREYQRNDSGQLVRVK